jgi:pimeloyl-ACP methyl ester carboxylesterase
LRRCWQETALSTPAFLGPTSHVYVSQRLRLHYVDWGNVGAPPLILVHGGRDHARSWDWVATELRRDFHVIAPDLRGHGDSAWSPDGAYAAPYFVYDLAQLIHSQGFASVRMVAHSLGGAIALRYAGLFPETVSKLVVVEGLGLSAGRPAAFLEAPVAERWTAWLAERRTMSGRLPRRYASIEEAFARMQAENKHLSAAQARHLTEHGVSRNEDGTYGWKFDNYIRSQSPVDITDDELRGLWARIACPTLLVHGRDSWVSHPERDGNAAVFQDARVLTLDNAGHWPHHDRFPAFMEALRGFL